MATEWQKPARKGPRQKGGKNPLEPGEKPSGEAEAKGAPEWAWNGTNWTLLI